MLPSLPPVDVVHRNNIHVTGKPAGRVLLFVHGFGCSQEMWRRVTPAFAEDYRIVLFDHVGSGGSDLSQYDPGKYDSLHGYAADILEIIERLELRDVVYIGHSVGAMMGVLASVRDPSPFSSLVLLSPSPCYVNDGDYLGGFDQIELDGLIDALDTNYFGWANVMAPVITGNPDRPELGEELTASFCTTDPQIAQHFAEVVFLSDNRDDLSQVSTPTLVIQSKNDPIAPVHVGQFVHGEIPGSRFTVIPVSGHCLHLSAPAEVSEAISAFLV
ncbi:alpha/beta hydrolase [Cryobacterium levicorallinum]|uniref:Alpha/beta hydrolase n=1 Tax=Cryobacterium levicorallinum TaxID=995038 RepID=A0A1I3B646_9MICO|nr:alpha/beta hydrolase [Cryobacterium levicorallinum]TFB83437.1 alpha/beta hydrolase [Cryobacterium levicorallinum]GEP26957.1 hydrolase [Cryobacterium levicorallinum]SFH57702.1 sigma-B regulation protein RsbQ [Cryobacterium levicorallinum]